MIFLSSVYPALFQAFLFFYYFHFNNFLNIKLPTAGKFRPLMGKVQSNLDAKVRKVTASGFAMVKQGAKSRPPVKDVLAAFTTDVCGVGPATASALLAVDFYPSIKCTYVRML